MPEAERELDAKGAKLGAKDLMTRKATIKLRMQGWQRHFEKDNGRPAEQADKTADATYMRYRRELKTVEAALALARELKSAAGPSALESLVKEVTRGAGGAPAAAAAPGAAAPNRRASGLGALFGAPSDGAAQISPNSAALAALGADTKASSAPRRKGCCVVS